MGSGTIDQEVGFIKGQQVAMQRELKEIKEDIKVVTGRMGEQDKVMARIEGSVKELLAATKGTDKHQIKVTTQIENSDGTSSVQAGIVTRVLRWPSLPWLVCIVLVMAMAVYCFAVLTGRPVSSFMPTRAAAPAAP